MWDTDKIDCRKIETRSQRRLSSFFFALEIAQSGAFQNLTRLSQFLSFSLSSRGRLSEHRSANLLHSLASCLVFPSYFVDSLLNRLLHQGGLGFRRVRLCRFNPKISRTEQLDRISIKIIRTLMQYLRTDCDVTTPHMSNLDYRNRKWNSQQVYTHPLP